MTWINNPSARPILTGTYAGDNTAARQIPTGFLPVFVCVLGGDNLLMVPGFARQIATLTLTVGGIHATDGFIVDQGTDNVGNRLGQDYFFLAIGL